MNILLLIIEALKSDQAMMRYHLFSQALKIALNKKILLEKDFYKDEPFLLNKIEKSKEKKNKRNIKHIEEKRAKRC